ncbi:glutamate--tRNA ligase [Anaerococcus lactolyticus]|uniref:Glutamate--tRNA ligase n=1 Tax=Anaerococcus lactolyticus S7-1-13 TaxID=1284686 RepID=A0A095X0Q2_9FIRM|nr:glutamate--tRNA ligase [Anaerococcus lactolyticus]KGF03650.1 glutamyl-tRNA synthetase [Anaerococcus lactolyticus S7-1-13]
MSEVRVRFAPSPTGYLHIGGLRTALFNYLYARHTGGKMLLRIEDTDRTRFVEGALENLLKALKWSGVEIDEGVMLDENGHVTEKGDCGPYIQSERVKAGIYDKYIDQLIEEGKAYYCFCSQERVDKVRDQMRADGLTPKYDGLCRSIPLEEAKQRVANGEEHTVRLKLPKDYDISFNDRIKGKITFNTDDQDDQVLIKRDGYPTYHFAVVVDDHLMGITHVVRGDEWISSTPKHVYLYEAFGWQAPEYIHLPTVLNKDHKKYSKRNGDGMVEDFIEEGYTPEGLINFLSLLGWSPDSEEEIFTMEELAKQFDFDRVNKTGAVFDKKKLDWVNGHYVRELSPEELAKDIKPYMIKAGLIDESYDHDKLVLLAETWQSAIDKFSDAPELAKNYYIKSDEIEYDDDAKEAISTENAKTLFAAFLNQLDQVDEIDADFAKSVMKTIQKETGIKGKDLWFPVRAAVTGSVHGPDLSNAFLIMGKDLVKDRLEYVRDNF